MNCHVPYKCESFRDLERQQMKSKTHRAFALTSFLVNIIAAFGQLPIYQHPAAVVGDENIASADVPVQDPGLLERFLMS
jgi:hypothetical protein